MIDVGAEGEASLLFCILWTTLPFSFEEKTSFNCECIQKGCRRATLKANGVKFKRLSYLASDPAQCDFGLWLVDKESLKEYPLISAGETVYKEDRVCLWDRQVCTGVHGRQVTVCAPVTLGCECAREDIWCEKQWVGERAEEIIWVCVCVWMRDREMKAWEELVRSWHRRWQLSAAAFHRPGIPHTPATSYMPTIPVCACAHWIILPTLFWP